MIQLGKTQPGIVNSAMRKESHGNLIILCVIFGIVAVALSLVELTIVVLLLLYFDLFLLALCLSFLIMSGSTVTEGPMIEKRNNDALTVNRRPRNRVNSFGIYVKYAAKGSDFSRREIALSLKWILVQKLGTISNPRALDTGLSADLDRVVFPYVSGSFLPPPLRIEPPDPESELPPAETRGKTSILEKQKLSPLKRHAYLESVERIISKMQDLS